MSSRKQSNRRPATRRSIWTDRSGAALVYVTVLATAIFGLIAVVIDLSRVEITHTAARSAAESIALAAASQLDGTSDAVPRALLAADTNLNLLVQNEQNHAQNAGAPIRISNIRFLNGLPAGDPTLPESSSPLDPFVLDHVGDPIGASLDARFVEITSERLTVNNTFIVAVGGGATSTTSASAVAGFTQVLCRRAPLAICNPMEDPINAGAVPGVKPPPLDIDDWRGRMVLIKASGPSSGWLPGDFSLVDIAGIQSTPAIWDALAEDEPDVCITARIDLKPGQVQGMRTALNTRFDMYENPFGKNNSNPKIYPAKNVVKGQVLNDPLDACSYRDPNPAVPPTYSMSMPRDQNSKTKESDQFPSPPAGAPTNGRRFGDGTWDCAGYVAAMQAPTGTPPVDYTGPCGPNEDGTVPGQSRYDMYRASISSPKIPDTSMLSTEGEDGSPAIGEKCYGGTLPLTYPVDRREVYFAVINCIELDLGGGNSNGDIPVEAFIRGFLVETVKDPPDGPEIFLEIVDIARPGGDDGVLHDIVQLYR